MKTLRNSLNVLLCFYTAEKRTFGDYALGLRAFLDSSTFLIHLNDRVILVYTSFQNGCHFSVLLFACKLALVASFKGKYSFVFQV